MFAINFWFCRGVFLRSAKPPMAEDEILTLREVGDYLKLTERTHYRLTHKRRVAAAQSGELLALPGPGY